MEGNSGASSTWSRSAKVSGGRRFRGGRDDGRGEDGGGRGLDDEAEACPRD